MAFDVYERSLDLLRALVPVLKKLALSDPDLTKQLRRAGTSISLNLAEGARRTGKDRRHLLRIALGSAGEVGSCLDTALALEYLGAEEIAKAVELADRVRAMTYRLTS